MAAISTIVGIGLAGAGIVGANAQRKGQEEAVRQAERQAAEQKRQYEETARKAQQQAAETARQAQVQLQTEQDKARRAEEIRLQMEQEQRRAATVAEEAGLSDTPGESPRRRRAAYQGGGAASVNVAPTVSTSTDTTGSIRI